MFSLLVVVVLSLVTYHVECKYHVQRIECIRVTECPIYAKLLQSRPSHSEYDTVRAAHCGFDHMIEKVWCPITVELPNDETSEIETRDASNHHELLSKQKLFPNATECDTGIERRLYGGVVTNIDEYPWTALLYYRKGNTWVSKCGGSLISKRYVLTAAHCILKSLDYVVLGEYDTRNDTDCEYYDEKHIECAPKPLKIKIEKISLPSEWHAANREDDIALLRLDRDVEFNDYVAPICLPPKNMKDLEVGTQVVVTGWGRTEEESESPLKRDVFLPIVSRDNCSIAQGKKITNKMICAGGVPGKDACFGDSGGPLFYLDIQAEHWKLVGVVSWSLKNGCGNAGIPGVYTWVPPYIDWIYKTVY